jgi:hypothetical protein
MSNILKKGEDPRSDLGIIISSIPLLRKDAKRLFSHAQRDKSGIVESIKISQFYQRCFQTFEPLHDA